MADLLEIVTLEVTEFLQNCRIVVPRGENLAAVIDPGGESARVLAELSARGWSCEQIWLTHSHLDHCAGVRELKEVTGAKLFAHPGEKFFRERVEEIALMYGVPAGKMFNCPEPDIELQGGEKLLLAGLEFEVLFTPGHSPGHVCFYERQSASLFDGDVLFAGSIGRTDLPGGETALLMASIREKLFTLPDETRVFSGHGPVTQIGVEKRSNPFLINHNWE